MSNVECQEHGDYRLEAYKEYHSYNQNKPIASNNSPWRLPNLQTATWSTSSHTISPASESSRDIYSPSMFAQDYPYGVPKDQSKGAEAEVAYDDMQSPFSAWPATETDTVLFADSKNGNDRVFPKNAHTNRQNYPKETKGLVSGNRRTTRPKSMSSITKSEPKLPISSKPSKRSPPTVSSSRRTKSARTSKPAKHPSPVPSSPSNVGSPSCDLEPKPRTNHNLTERKYRNRLNEQFDTLLSALPSEAGSSRARDSDPQARRVSKAEVLILAKERIEALEREKTDLECQRCKMRNALDTLQISYGSINYPT